MHALKIKLIKSRNLNFDMTGYKMSRGSPVTQQITLNNCGRISQKWMLETCLYQYPATAELSVQIVLKRMHPCSNTSFLCSSLTSKTNIANVIELFFSCQQAGSAFNYCWSPSVKCSDCRGKVLCSGLCPQRRQLRKVRWTLEAILKIWAWVTWRGKKVFQLLMSPESW